jgi:hypothetical protein
MRISETRRSTAYNMATGTTPAMGRENDDENHFNDRNHIGSGTTTTGKVQ